jgi:hypothetical protein
MISIMNNGFLTIHQYSRNALLATLSTLSTYKDKTIIAIGNVLMIAMPASTLNGTIVAGE